MPISAEQWRAVVGSNNPRRQRQVISIEQLLLRYFSKQLTETSSQRDGVDTTKGTSKDATLDNTAPSLRIQAESLCSSKNYSVTASEVETAVVVQVMISAACVQVLQSFVSMVAMSLLILSGDVETNPGPTDQDSPEYRTIVACTDRLTTAIAQGVSALGLRLFGKYLISEDTRDQLMIPATTKKEKASILIQAIQYSVKSNSENFHKFIDVLKQEPWLQDIVKEVNREYQKVKAGQVPIPTASPISAREDIPKGKPATILTSSHVDPLWEALWDVRVQWSNIGSCLRVPQSSLDEIKHNFQSFCDDGQRLKKVLSLWIGNGKATIHDLLKALNGKIIRRVDIANEICQRRGEQRTDVGLCTTRCDVCFPNGPNAPVTVPVASPKLNFETLLQTERLTAEELKKRLDGNDLFDLARLFDNAEFYVDRLQLSPGEKTDVKGKAATSGTHLAMCHALGCWKSHNPLTATFETLLLIVLELDKGEIAINICDYYRRKYTAAAAPVRENQGGIQSAEVMDPNLNYQVQKANGDLVGLSSTEEPVPHSAYCGLSQRENQQGIADVSGGAPGQCDPKKLWPIADGKNDLKVYFMNEEVLKSLGLNTDNIMDAARMWNHYSPSGNLKVLKGLIPTFTHTSKQSDSDIRILIAPNGGSWSKVGVDADSIDKSEVTMTLGLVKGKKSYNRHIVIHEFGHALGLEHEHQRSIFWSVAEKFLDVSKMKQDQYLQGTDVDGSYLIKCPPGGSQDYDSESVMHYWFRKEWLKDQYKQYQKVSKVQKATELSPEEKKVLLGIHKRDMTLADKPSDTDYEYLAREYYHKKHGLYLSSPSSNGAGTGVVSSPGQGPPAADGLVMSDQEKSGEPPSPEAQPLAGESAPQSQETTDSTHQDDSQGDSQIERDSTGIPVAEQLPQLLETISDIAKRMNKPDTVKQTLHSDVTKIGVIGTNNSGKSTTLNALLGGRFLPASSGRTTARVLCIKHDPNKPNGELYDVTQEEMLLASGRNEIHKELEKLNEEGRSDMSRKQLELRVNIPFLADCNTPDNQCNAQLYDTPGACEDKDSQIYKDAKQTVEEMDGLILVLSQDTVELESTVTLLGHLRRRFPLFLSAEGKPNRGIVLVNKKDKFHDDFEEDDDVGKHMAQVARKCEQISKRVDILEEKMVFCSAKLGLEARKLRVPPVGSTAAAQKRSFNKLLHDISKLPENRETVEDLEERKGSLPIEEAAKELADITESVSNIKEVENRIVQSCPLFKKLKAVDDALYRIQELMNVAKQEEQYAYCTELTTVKRKLENVEL